MRLTVFGSTGRVGRLLTEQALAAGHQVTAFARTPAALPEPLRASPGLRLVAGTAEDAARVAEAVQGADAVLSTVGHAKGSRPDVLTAFAGVLLPAMRAAGVPRLVSLVGAGVADPRDERSLGQAAVRGLMRLVARAMLVDAEGHARLVRASDRAWTLVRPPRLTDDPPTGRVRAGYFAAGPGERLTRGDLAAWMLAQAGSDEWARAAPIVANH
jgi:putative NADH-flavin reductase